MNLKAKCVLCDDVLEYVRSDTKNLIDHVLQKHKETDLDYLKLQKMYTVTKATSTSEHECQALNEIREFRSNHESQNMDESEEEETEFMQPMTSRDNFEEKLLKCGTLIATKPILQTLAGFQNN